MSEIDFSNEEKDTLVNKLSEYFRDNLDQELGQFDGEFLLDFISKEIGPYYYNRGLYDARGILESRLEVLTEAIYEIEKPTDFVR